MNEHERRISPSEELCRVAEDICHGYFLSSSVTARGVDSRPMPKPGETYQNLPEEKKAVLKQLTSDQASNVRMDLASVMYGPGTCDYWRKKQTKDEVSALLTKFDKEVLGLQ